MSFLNNLLHHGDNQGGQHYQQQGPPQPPYPWIAEWDQRDNRWIYINRETGQRSWEFPRQGGSSYGGQQSYGGGGYSQGYGGQQGYGQPQQAIKPDRHGRNMALGVGAGVVGGALLMHEGEELSKLQEPVLAV